MPKKKQTFTPEQARLILDTHDIEQVFDGGEEEKLLQANNPGLFDAYKALMAFAESESEP